jgi:hypothetical protein
MPILLDDDTLRAVEGVYIVSVNTVKYVLRQLTANCYDRTHTSARLERCTELE